MVTKILFHATFESLAERIEAEGLRCRNVTRHWPDSREGRVYLALDPFVAESFAECAETEDFSEDGIVVFAIDATLLDENNLAKDENNDGDTLEYRGDIPAAALTRVELSKWVKRRPQMTFA